MMPWAPITVVRGADASGGGRTHGQSNKHMLVEWVTNKEKCTKGSRRVGLEPLASNTPTALSTPSAPWHIDVIDGLVGSRLSSFIHMTSKNTIISIYKKEKDGKKCIRGSRRVYVSNHLWFVIPGVDIGGSRVLTRWSFTNCPNDIYYVVSASFRCRHLP